MAAIYVVSSEAEAFALLEQLIGGLDIEGVQVQFLGWPRFVIHIAGKDFDRTIPTRIMHPLLELQRQVNRLYAQTVYGNPAHRLSRADRERLELVVRVGDGSSWYETLLDHILAGTLQEAVSKMNGGQVTAVLLVFGVAIGSAWGWSVWRKRLLEERQIGLQEKMLDQSIQLSRLDKEKLDILARAMAAFPLTVEAAMAAHPVRDELARRLQPEDRLTIPVSDPNDPQAAPVTIDGDTAKQLVKAPRATAIERIVEDQYWLRVADFSQPGVLRVDLERVSDGYSFRAKVPAGVLTYDQEQALRDKGWDRQVLALQVLVNEIGQRYTSAKVIAVRAP